MSVVAGRHRCAGGFTLAELVSLALIAALIVLSKSLFRISIHVPGHSGLTWMALLLIARGTVRHPWAGTVVGVVSGLLAVFLAPGSAGIFTWIKYAAPGLALDGLVLLVPGGMVHPVSAALIGAFANLAKLAAGYILAVLLGLPATFIALGLGVASVSHAAFGAAGGALGAMVLVRLYRARPQLAPRSGGASGAERGRPQGDRGPSAFAVFAAVSLTAVAGVLSGPGQSAVAATVWSEGTPTRTFGIDEFSSAVLVGGSDPAIIPTTDVLWSVGFAGLDPRSAELVEGGNILVASRDGRAVLELDRSGRVVWKFDERDYRAATGDAAAEFMPFHVSRSTGADGGLHALITLRRGAPVIEVDRGRRIVWRFGTGEAGFGPGQTFDAYSSTRLANGNTLIADNHGGRVMEIRTSDYDPDVPLYGFTEDSVVWQYGVAGELASAHGYAEGYLDWPRTAVRLENGNTLITDEAGARAIEVTPARHVVWQYGTPGVYGVEEGRLFEPSGAVRLPDGTTAIAHGRLEGRIDVVDPAGRVVRRFPDPATTPTDPLMSAIRSITLASSGAMVLTDEGNDRVLGFGAATTAKVTSGPIDCGLPGVRKSFSALESNAVTPSGTAVALYYSLDAGPWLTVPAGGVLPEGTQGVFIRYRAILATTDNLLGARIEDVSVTYAPVSTGDDGDDGGAVAPVPGGETTRTIAPSTSGTRRAPARRSTKPVQLVPKALAAGSGSRSAPLESVQVGGDLPPGLVEASGRLLGRVTPGTTDPGDGSGTGGAAGAPFSPGGLALLGGVYMAGFAASPLKSAFVRLALRRT